MAKIISNRGVHYVPIPLLEPVHLLALDKPLDNIMKKKMPVKKTIFFTEILGYRSSLAGVL